MLAAMITPRQIRAARALMDWSQQELADNAIVSLNALARLERGLVDPRTSTLSAVETALVGAGIEFIPASNKGEGVRLLLPQPEGRKTKKVPARKKTVPRRTK
jgi:transcriptional regulator with XRE-family HTH domain